jgi:hypothetical protein
VDQPGQGKPSEERSGHVVPSASSGLRTTNGGAAGARPGARRGARPGARRGAHRGAGGNSGGSC